MFYLKYKGKNLPIDADNVFTVCPRCGREFAVDIQDVIEGGGDLYGTSIHCKACSEKFIKEWDERAAYAADPCQLDMAAMALLNSGIMSAHELSILADKFEGNDTMCRIIASYAEKIPNDREARLLSVSLNRNKRAEQESAFDALVMMIKKTIQDSEYAAEGMEKHWDEIYSNAVGRLN